MSNLKSTLILVTGFLSSAVSMAATVKVIEPVFVKSIVQSGNLMPVVDGPERPIDTTVTFLAMSGGCTNEKSFKAVISETKSKKQKLSLVRVVLDDCEAVSSPVEIKLQVKNAKNSQNYPIVIQNPIMVETNFVY